MAQLMRGLGSLAVLLLGLAGVPTALVLLAGNPLPRELAWSTVLRALVTPVDGAVLVRLIAIIGWLAWLVFAMSVISELVAIASRQRIRISSAWTRCTATIRGRPTDLGDHDDLVAAGRSGQSGSRTRASRHSFTARIDQIDAETDRVTHAAHGRSAAFGAWRRVRGITTSYGLVMISGAWLSGTTVMGASGAGSPPRIRRS